MVAPKRKSIEGSAGAPRKKIKSPEKAAPSRILRPQTEKEFIRGGGGPLTQQERKKIASKAAQDVLFEQDGGGAAPASDSEDEENVPAAAPAATATKRKHRQSDGQNKQIKKDTPVYEERVIPEGLNPKKLVPGAKVLGQICEVRRNELILSLPNNLTGYVSITAISDGLNGKLEDLMRDDSSDETDNESLDIDLKSLFHTGQFLRAAVPPAEAKDESAASKRRLGLSINPILVNRGLLKSEVGVNTTVQVEVLSVEDHGIVVGLGLDQPDLRGFIPSKELPNKSVQGIQEGAVLLCIVTGLGSNGKVVKLSTDPQKLGNVPGGSFVKSSLGVGALLPGTAVEFTISNATASGLVGKVFGLVDITADILHSGGLSQEAEMGTLYPMGSKHQGRLIWTSEFGDRTHIGISLLPHTLQLGATKGHDSLPTLDFKASQIVDDAKVIAVEPRLGLLLDIGSQVASVFVHISRVSDERVESLSATTGPYMIGTKHRCRLLGYNYIDQLYLASLAPKTLALPFLQLEDLSEGDHVRGTVDRLTNPTSGSTGLLVHLTDTVTGFVPALHLSDVALSHPERKFRTGIALSARVLSIDLEKRGLKLTLKKTLVNSDAPVWNSYDSVSVGASAPGTIIKFVPTGAVIQFYGQLQGLLPLSQMSETYIADPEQQFRLGQVITVRVLSLDRARNRLILTCREAEDFGPEQQQALEGLVLGRYVQGKVIEKTRNEIVLDVMDSNLKAILPCEHLVDGSETAVEEAAKRIHIGQTMKQLMVCKKDFSRGRLSLTKKPSLMKAMGLGKLPARYGDLAEGVEVTGYVSNIIEHGVFVAFLGDLTALLPRSSFDANARNSPNFGYRVNQSITAFVMHLEHDSGRITLSQRQTEGGTRNSRQGDGIRVVNNAVDGVTKSLSEFSIGKLTTAKITAVKETQLNVLLADGIPGRIDVSEAFDDWTQIKDKKHPLKQFQVDQKVEVRILGMHDSKNHRFLPFSHTGKARVFELSAKLKASEADPIALDGVRPGSHWLCFVNNVTDHGLWVNLSPNVRGRIPPMDISNDATLYSDLLQNFPVGCALQAKVIRIDPIANKLELSSRSDGSHGPVSMSSLSVGSVIPAAVTKVTPESVIVQLSETLSAPIHLADLSDDYGKASPQAYQKGTVIPVCVLKVDELKNKIRLSARPSRVQSSRPPVTDREVLQLQDLKVNDICRGFVKNIANNGIFVALAPDINALVKISDVSDSFIKDWSAGFEANQLVRGKIIGVDTALNRVQMSLKESTLSKDYKPLLTYNDVHVGDLLTGKIRKIEDFGIFIVVDNSSNVSGLCHRSELADGKISQVRALYDEGDAVQAVVLKVDTNQRRISFTMKASRVEAAKSSVLDVSEDEFEALEGGVALPEESEEFSMETTVPSVVPKSLDHPLLPNISETGGLLTGLSGGGFSWAAPSLNEDMDKAQSSDSDLDSDAKPSKKSKRKKQEPVVDRTADLDAYGPRSGADFERLLLGQPNASILWIQYMAFELQQGEIDKARAIAERAVRSVNHQTRETEAEAMNVWVAYLNLENTYGTEDSLEAIFERACEYNDPEDVHSKLASIYIQSGKLEKADELLQTMIKKFSVNPKIWFNYASFLFDVRAAPEQARELLPKALQSLPGHQHVELTSKFAQLEFRSKNGQAERGRTIFEGLFSNFPKRLDLWNVLLDLEIKTSDREQVRKLFDRIVSRNLKASKAHKFFKKWLAYEEKVGDRKSRERVEAKAAEYVKKQQQRSDK